tara:strand:+ start:285 stop:1304 length:1020 start_codon:yes stop_codon:yes gene_type:complete
MKKYLSIAILLFNTIFTDSIVYYYSDSNSQNFILKEIENIKYLGLLNDEFLIFQIKKISDISIPDNLTNTSINTFYRIKKNQVNTVNYLGKSSYRSIVYRNVENNIFIDYLKTDFPLSDPIYEIAEPIIIKPEKIETTMEENISNKLEPSIYEVLPSSHVTIGYSVKQNMNILNREYAMLGNFTYGYIWLANSGNKNNIDVGIEYSPKIKKSYFGNKFLEVSLFDIYGNWRLPNFTNKLQSYLRFGISHILDFKIWGDSFKSEFNIDLRGQPDGGFNYGIGLFYNKNLFISIIQYKLFLNDSYSIYEVPSGHIVPPFDPGSIIKDPEFDILRINITRLF